MFEVSLALPPFGIGAATIEYRMLTKFSSLFMKYHKHKHHTDDIYTHINLDKCLLFTQRYTVLLVS